MARRWTRTELDAVLWLARLGLPADAIATTIDRSLDALRHALRFHDCPSLTEVTAAGLPQRLHWTDQGFQHALRCLLDAGWSRSDIARALDTNLGNLTRQLARHGIAPPSRPRPQQPAASRLPRISGNPCRTWSKRLAGRRFTDCPIAQHRDRAEPWFRPTFHTNVRSI